jgi:NADPH:quinone reductase-like Zn-dependent oxidoreductase
MATPSMKAVRVHAYGGPEVLTFEDVPCPTPGRGEVLIKVAATTVNPFDCALRAGYLSGMLPIVMPYIPGTDIAGVVEAVGPGVEEFRPGDRVFARGGVMRDGSSAEFTVVPESDLALSPASLDPIHAAALPHVTLTAWQALFELAGLSAGQTVLIHGAAGGVGHVAVQLAKWRGAHVIGTTSRNEEFVRSLGADEVINYAKEPFEKRVSGVDVVLDTIGGDTQERSWKVLKPGGILVSVIQAPSEDSAAAHGVRHAFVYSTPPIGPTLNKVAKLVEEGTLKPEVSAVLPLNDIRKAHEMVEGKHVRGKVVLQVS